MTSINLNSDGFSFHTTALNIHPDSETFNTVLKKLYSAAENTQDPSCRTYPLSLYRNSSIHPHCSTVLSQRGILLYLTELMGYNSHYYTITAKVNPRKVLNPDADYLGIAPTDCNSLKEFSDQFTHLVREYGLPKLDEWNLNRIDLCVNLELNKKKTAREFCRLLQRDLIPPKLDWVSYFDPDVDEATQKEQRDSSVCLTNQSYQIVVYDKLLQAKVEGLNVSPNPLDGVLRFELRCSRTYIDKLLDGEDLESTLDKICWLAQNSRKFILSKAKTAFSLGTHYKPDTAQKIIEASDYQERTRKQLRWLVGRMRYPFNLEQLERRMWKQFHLLPRTVAQRLNQLQKLGINLVPLRQDFYLNQLPSLPLILELLEDDSTTVKLKSNGEIVY